MAIRLSHTLGSMLLSNKKRLDSIYQKESSLLLIYKISFLIDFVLMIFVANYFFEEMAAEYKNSLKVSVCGTLKSSIDLIPTCPIGNIPPAEAEAIYYNQFAGSAMGVDSSK